MPDLDHLRIDGTTYDLKDSTAREKDAVQDNELSSLKSAFDGYVFGVNQVFTHSGGTAWEYFPCLLLKDVSYRVTNNNTEHSMAVKLRTQDGTEYSAGSAPAGGSFDFVVPDDGYIEIGGYMYNGASFVITNEYSNYETVSHKADIYDLRLSDKGIQTFGTYGNFQHYGLKPDGTFMTTQTYRVSNDNIMTFDRDLYISVADGFRWGYIPFTNGTAGAWSGWFTTPISINANTNFVVQIARVTEDTSEIADVDEFVHAVTFLTTVGTQTEYIPTILDSIGLNSLETTWVQGGIGGTGADDPTNRRIRTGYIAMGDFLDIVTNTGYFSVVVQYDENYSMVSGTNWASGKYTIQKHDNAKYFRCALAKTISGSTTIDISESVNISIKIGYKDIGGRLVTIENEIIGGSNQYLGEKIPSKVNSFSTKKIFRITYDGTQETPQDVDIYGDYFVFAFAKNENQSIKIYSMTDYSLLANISIDVQHGSGIQFSNEFYNESDIMPLLYAGGWVSNRINVIRITKSGDTWEATIVRTLKLSNDEGYYLAPSIDSKNNIMYCYGYKINSLAAQNNAMELVKCDLTDLTDNGDGTYSPAIINRIETPYMGVMQGRKYYNNRLYIGFANTSSPANCRLVCVNVEDGKTMTDIDLSSIVTVESEGLCYQIIGNNILWYYTDYNNVFELSFS